MIGWKCLPIIPWGDYFVDMTLMTLVEFGYAAKIRAHFFRKQTFLKITNLKTISK